MRRKIVLPLVLVLAAAFGGLAPPLAAGNSPEVGLDLEGGGLVVVQPTGDRSGDQLDQAVEIIRDRVDALGVAEPDITRQGDAIVVQLPGVRNRDRALALVGQTAELRFRPVLQQAPVDADALADAQEAADAAAAQAAGEGATTTTTAPAEGDAEAQVPELTPRSADTADATVTLAGKDGATVYMLGPSQAT